jgi:filamentous hemagglutinin family protein
MRGKKMAHPVGGLSTEGMRPHVQSTELEYRIGKRGRAAVLGAWVCLALSTALAAPQGGQVSGGSGTISVSGNTTTISQSSDRLNLNWQRFNVGTNETVNFVQPSASALAVNRILDTNGSQMLGRLNANGQVWLINPNGVLFGQGAQVHVGSIVASTLSPEDASIGSARTRFSGSSTAAVVNLGQINAAQGGYVALLGHSVSNQGTISAPGGTAALGGGSTVSLQFAGSKLLGLEVSSNQIKALADNGGLIQADGGQVLLSAGARDSLLASVVNNTGVIQAQTVQEQDGKIILLAGMAAGTTTVGGTLDASAPKGGNGGFIETSAATVKVGDEARITTLSRAGRSGLWLIDPTDYTIASSGGDMTGTALGTSLASGNVEIQTTSGGSGSDGNLYVNDTVTWSSGNTLTLTAYNSIYIYKTIDASASSGGVLALKYGQGSASGTISGTAASYTISAPVNLQAGSNFSTRLGTSGSTTTYTVITSLGSAGDESAAVSNSLQGLAYSSKLSGNYVLGADIDASATATSWNCSGGSCSGFVPIGDNSSPFTGTLDGLGHTIDGLSMYYRTTRDYVGLVGYASSTARIANLGLTTASVIGRDDVGGLVGYNAGTVSKAYVSGDGVDLGVEDYGVKGDSRVGGLVGTNSGTISASYASITSLGSGSNVGGLVGYNTASGSIDQSYSTYQTYGSTYVGGLIGYNAGSVTSSYSTSYAETLDAPGGLVGYNTGSIATSYASGTMSNNNDATDYGGLVGQDGGGTITSSYYINGSGNALGTSITNSGTPNPSKQASSYSGFDFDSVWVNYDDYTKPLLRTFLTALTVTVNTSGSTTYDGTTYGCNGGVFTCSVSYTDSLSKVYGTVAYSLSAQAAGSYNASASGLYSDQLGYLISYADGTSGTITSASSSTNTDAVTYTSAWAHEDRRNPLPSDTSYLPATAPATAGAATAGLAALGRTGRIYVEAGAGDSPGPVPSPSDTP